MNHLRNMYLYFLASTVVTLLLGIGTTVSGSWLFAGLAALGIAGFAVLGGIFGTMQMRGWFNLMQTGRVLQWASFIASAYVGVLVFGFIFSGALTVASPLLTALTLFVLAFGPAMLTGEVPVRGRTWLPVRRK